MADHYDSPWKEIVGEYFPDFLSFFFPEAHAGINWQLGWVSRDTELAPGSRSNTGSSKRS